MARRGSLDEHIAASAQLRTLRREAERLAAASARLDEVLGDELAGRARLARLEQAEVVLVAGSAAWATRLRFMAPLLARHFAAEHGSAQTPRVVVRVDPPPPAGATPRAREPLSARSARLLDSVAAGCDDPRLAAVLRRLSARASPPRR